MQCFLEEKIDYLVCSDCLYEESPWEKLLETIVYFSKINPKIQIIFAYKKRYVYQEQFLNEISIYLQLNFRENIHNRYNSSRQYYINLGKKFILYTINKIKILNMM